MQIYRQTLKFIPLACTLLIAQPLFAEAPDPQSQEAGTTTADEAEATGDAGEPQSTTGEATQEATHEEEPDNEAPSGAGTVTEQEVEQLRLQCESAREELIAPLRKAAIEECIAKKVKSPEGCEKFYRDFGEAGNTQFGTFRQRRFHNIAECQPFYEAEKILQKGNK